MVYIRGTHCVGFEFNRGLQDFLIACGLGKTGLHDRSELVLMFLQSVLLLNPTQLCVL